MTDEWIIVPNWHRFQHYTDRNPPWIKLYTELLHNDDWCGLSDAQKGLLCSIWLEYAASNGNIRASRMASIVRPNRLQSSLTALQEAGFIQLSADKPLALARSQETETEKRRIKRSRAEESEQRQNAGAYHKHHTEHPDETVPIETIEAYLMGLQTPHFTDVADD